MKPTHTPTPWEYRPCLDTGLTRPYEKFDIFHTTPPEHDNDYGINTGSKKVFIGVIRSQPSKTTTEANAALIVRAVNNHAVLMEQMEANASISSFERLEECSKATLISLLCAIRNQAQEALKTAKGE